MSFLRDAATVREARSRPDTLNNLFIDAKGGGPLNVERASFPSPRSTRGVSRDFGELSKKIAARGTRLVVVSFPPSPEWRRKFDAQGLLLDAFEAQIRSNIAAQSSFIAHDIFNSDDGAYVDGVHLRWDAAKRYSEVLARTLSSSVMGPKAGLAAEARE